MKHIEYVLSCNILIWLVTSELSIYNTQFLLHGTSVGVCVRVHRCWCVCARASVCVDMNVHVCGCVMRALTDGKQYAVTTATFVASSGAEASSACPIYFVSHTVLQAEQWTVCVVNGR